MTRLAFDIEGDDLLDKVTKIHCIVTKDLDGGTLRWYHDHPGEKAGDIEEGIRSLEEADEIWAHNGIRYDVPALQKLYGFKPKGLVRDTLITLRLILPDTMDYDTPLVKRGILPQNLMGRHSLEAWGHRIGNHKAGYKGGFETFSQEMLDYCVQDVEVLADLVHKIEKKNYSQQAIELEHKFAGLIFLQEENGFGIDLDKAHALHTDLMARYNELQNKLREVFPARIEQMKTPAYWVAWDGDQEVHFPTKGAAQKKGYKEIEKGPNKTKEIPFNPSSRPECADRLRQKYKWKAPEKLGDDVFASLDYPEAKLIAEYLMIKKRLGQVSDGKAAWLKLEKNGKIHGYVNTNGAVTGRCTHSRPNMAQVPKASDKVPFGARCRGLFQPTRSGWVQVGFDASGLELRVFAHYLAIYDDGAYAREVVEGDIHTFNQKAAGLETRDQAKTFCYGTLYGAGDQKIGQIVGAGAKRGKALRKQFMDNVPAYASLLKAVQAKAKSRGTLKGLDGRVLQVRSSHSALNTLLQSAGAVIMKQALIEFVNYLNSQGLVMGEDYALMANVHDEVQSECRPEVSDVLMKAGPAAIKRAGEVFKFRCQLDGESKRGPNWAACH